MHIGFLHHAVEVVHRSRELGFGVIPQRGRDFEIAAMDQKLHTGTSLPCGLNSMY